MKPKHARFYLIMTILLLVVVLLGFGKPFFLRAFFDQPIHLVTLPSSVYVHGGIMTLWFMMLVVQSALVNVRNVKLHKNLGWGLLVLSLLVIISGLVVNAGVFPRLIALGVLDPNNENLIRMAASLWTYDIIVLIPFSIMIGIAVLQRNNIIVHRSMMLGASMLLTNPAIFRMTGWMFPDFAMGSAILIYLLFPLMLLGYDWLRYKKFPLYAFIGLLAIVVVSLLMILLPATNFWMELFLKTINL